MLMELDRLIKQRKELKKWWEFRHKLATYSGARYELKTCAVRATVAFCGEDTYKCTKQHDAPPLFVEGLENEIRDTIDNLATAAYYHTLERIDAQIEAQSAAAMKELFGEEKNHEHA